MVLLQTGFAQNAPSGFTAFYRDNHETNGILHYTNKDLYWTFYDGWNNDPGLKRFHERYQIHPEVSNKFMRIIKRYGDVDNLSTTFFLNPRTEMRLRKWDMPLEEDLYFSMKTRNPNSAFSAEFFQIMGRDLGGGAGPRLQVEIHNGVYKARRSGRFTIKAGHEDPRKDDGKWVKWELYYKLSPSESRGYFKLYKDGVLVWEVKGATWIAGVTSQGWLQYGCYVNNNGIDEMRIDIDDIILARYTGVVNQAPSVSISSPLNNSNYTEPASINITANANDADGTISKVEFFNGSTKLGERTTSPYTFSWTGVLAGTYNVTATATDNQGAKSSATVLIIVKAPVSTNIIGISGPSCVNSGGTYSYTVTPEASHNTISWWSNSGATINQDPTDNKKVTIFIPDYMNNTSFVLTSGVNMSVSPWYKEYSRTIKVGGCAAARTANLGAQPFSDFTSISFDDNVKIISLKVIDSKGQIVLAQENINNSSFIFGSELSQGLYTLYITSEEGTTVSKIFKQ